MANRFEPFFCDCGGTVRMLSAKGERYDITPFLVMHIPERVRIPRCERCGESYFSEKDSLRVRAAVRHEVFRAWFELASTRGHGHVGHVRKWRIWSRVGGEMRRRLCGDRRPWKARAVPHERA